MHDRDQSFLELLLTLQRMAWRIRIRCRVAEPGDNEMFLREAERCTPAILPPSHFLPRRSLVPYQNSRLLCACVYLVAHQPL